MAVSTKSKKKHRFSKALIIVVLIGLILWVTPKNTWANIKSELYDNNYNNSEYKDPQKIDTKKMQTSNLEPELIDNLNQLASEDNSVKNVINNIDIYPEDLIRLLIKNPDARDFVVDYPKHRNKKGSGKIKSSELPEGIPHFLQWDERWGYSTYGSGVIGTTGCGPTCLSMVIVGLTGNKDATPYEIANFSEKNGYYIYGSGTSWDLMSIACTQYGITSSVVPLSEDLMVSELRAGHPLIVNVGPGDFTESGHFIVIKGYENGKFMINDPNSKKLSGEGWYYSTLEKQIMNIWAYSLS